MLDDEVLPFTTYQLALKLLLGLHCSLLPACLRMNLLQLHSQSFLSKNQGFQGQALLLQFHCSTSKPQRPLLAYLQRALGRIRGRLACISRPQNGNTIPQRQDLSFPTPFLHSIASMPAIVPNHHFNVSNKTIDFNVNDYIKSNVSCCQTNTYIVGL